MGIVILHLNQITAGLELALEVFSVLLPPWSRAASELGQTKGVLSFKSAFKLLLEQQLQSISCPSIAG